MKFISTNIQYPKSCIEQGISGRVYISFVVEKDGTCTGHKVLRGIAAAPEIDREALRVIRMLTGFQPAMQNGKPVRFQYTIPINFRR